MAELQAAFIEGRSCAGRGAWVRRRGPLGTERPAFRAASADDVDQAMQSAARAFPAWSRTPFAERLAVLERFAVAARARHEGLARILAEEVGKPLWECREEASALAGKVELTVRAFSERASEKTTELAGFRGVQRFRPHGVFAVFSPYNLPMHLPNGHILPALLGGNTVVLKSSELAPQSAMALVELLVEAGLPPEAIQLLPGERATGEAIVAHPLLRGLAFTGSSPTGRAIHRALGGRTEVISALEMGGNNPMLVLPDADPSVMGPLVVLSSMLTSGQRCTSARRLIVPEGAAGDRIVDAVVQAAASIRIDRADAEDEPFCGPLVAPEAADGVWRAWEARVAAGARVLLPMTRLESLSPAALTPGIVDATGIALPDEEVFGPLLHVVRVPDFEAGLRVAADTHYGLSAALCGGGEADFARFVEAVPAGIVNRNRPTNGALSTQPFGGNGWSGNHRPAGFTSVDYCVWAMASTESEAVALPAKMPPGFGPSAPRA